MLTARPATVNCGKDTILLIDGNGNALIRPHWCQKRGCQIEGCKWYVASQYFHDQDNNLEWIGYIPPQNWHAIRKQANRKGAWTKVISFSDSPNRLVASDTDLRGTTTEDVMAKKSVVETRKEITEVLVTRQLRRVQPGKHKKPKEYEPADVFHSPDEQQEVLIHLGYTPHPIYESMWIQPSTGAQLTQQEALRLIKGEFDSVRFQ